MTVSNAGQKKKSKKYEQNVYKRIKRKGEAGRGKQMEGKCKQRDKQEKNIK